jgi:EAL domain-containing protein (putative c-di-GMP-specific phosphodiesterase class I)
MGFDGPTLRLPKLTCIPSVGSAIENGQVYVDLQPVVELATGRIHGYEALARCKLEGLAAPLQMFATAIEQGVLGHLGRELRRLSVKAANGATLFLNVHPIDLDSQDLVGVDDPISKHQGKLVLEVPGYSMSNLDTLRARGIEIALDAFGAGCSSFGYIAQLDPEIVKIDRELIAGVKLHSRQHKLLTSLAALCMAQGATVVAEGIETRDELMAVMAAGIPLAQGYFLGRPSLTGASTWTPS